MHNGLRPKRLDQGNFIQRGLEINEDEENDEGDEEDENAKKRAAFRKQAQIEFDNVDRTHKADYPQMNS